MGRRALPILAALVACAGVPAAVHAVGSPAPGVVRGAGGVVAPGNSLRYLAFPAGRRTVVAAVRVRSGRVVRYRSIAGAYGVPAVAFDGTSGGLAADGRTLVLAQPRVGRPSRFAVLSTGTLRVRRSLHLRGTFSFDAVSPDGRWLYLIEHLGQPQYRVRVYDLASGRLARAPIADPALRKARMAGYPAARATSTDGRWAYTLYRNGDRTGFVHALDTARRAAVCVGLPRPGERLALHGTRLVVTRADGARVAVVDTRRLRLVA